MGEFEARYLSPTEFAKIFGSSRQNITNLIKNGKIKAIRINNRWKIPIQEAKRIKKEGA